MSKFNEYIRAYNALGIREKVLIGGSLKTAHIEEITSRFDELSEDLLEAMTEMGKVERAIEKIKAEVKI